MYVVRRIIPEGGDSPSIQRWLVGSQGQGTGLVSRGLLIGVSLVAQVDKLCQPLLVPLAQEDG